MYAQLTYTVYFFWCPHIKLSPVPLNFSIHDRDYASKCSAEIIFSIKMFCPTLFELSGSFWSNLLVEESSDKNILEMNSLLILSLWFLAQCLLIFNIHLLLVNFVNLYTSKSNLCSNKLLTWICLTLLGILACFHQKYLYNGSPILNICTLLLNIN